MTGEYAVSWYIQSLKLTASTVLRYLDQWNYTLVTALHCAVYHTEWLQWANLLLCAESTNSQNYLFLLPKCHPKQPAPTLRIALDRQPRSCLVLWPFTRCAVAMHDYSIGDHTLYTNKQANIRWALQSLAVTDKCRLRSRRTHNT
eukprot:GHVU01034718.1.p1 GENE.GHVU01034718.1~~GHVU01034718.1.p1  ORF type:complete len:145 (-),score=0.20 GHVU01034718.1:102-536(-)